jgi:NAD(P)-dependent dehydrogenase (short-subunit alcohol dehydrogenase family)
MTGWPRRRRPCPFGKLAKPDELAVLIAYLVSPQSGVMTGSVIDYDQNVIGLIG